MASNNMINQHFKPPVGVGIVGQYIGSDGVGGSQWSTPPGVTFSPANTLYFGPGGNDSKPGNNPNEPLLTAAQAYTNAVALIGLGATYVAIYGVGTGIDTSNLNITTSGLYWYAPGIQLNPVTGDAITVDLSGGSVGSYINMTFASSTVEAGAKVMNLIGTTSGNDNVTLFNFLGKSQGDVYLNVPCDYYTTIITGNLTVNQSGTNVTTQYGIGGNTQQNRLNMAGPVYSAGGTAWHGATDATNVWRYPMRKIIYLTGDITLNSGSSGFLFVNNTTGNYTVTLPATADQGTPAFLIGYEATFLNITTGSISFVPTGEAVISGARVLDRAAQRANASLIAANAWEVDNFEMYSPSDMCVSKLWGSDVRGDGSPNNPWATLNSGLTAIGITSTVTNLRILDNETYDEALDFTGLNNINLIGSQASIIYTGLSDAITTNSSLMTIDLFELSATGGGKTLNNTGTGAIHINETILAGGDVDNASTGLISIIGDAIFVNMPNTGGGQIYYTCNIRSGIDGAGVLGQYPKDTWSTFVFPWNAWLGTTGSFQTSGDNVAQYYVPWSARSGGTVLNVTSNSNQDYGFVTFTVETAGTYLFYFTYLGNNQGGIFTLNLDSGAVVQNVDSYNVSNPTLNASWTANLSSGTHTLGFTVTSKNPSSSGYQVQLQEYLTVTRIA